MPAAADWGLSCPFPGDLFAQFERLQGLYLSFNNLTVGGGAPCMGCLSPTCLESVGEGGLLGASSPWSQVPLAAFASSPPHLSPHSAWPSVLSLQGYVSVSETRPCSISSHWPPGMLTAGLSLPAGRHQRGGAQPERPAQPARAGCALLQGFRPADGCFACGMLRVCRHACEILVRCTFPVHARRGAFNSMLTPSCPACRCCAPSPQACKATA